MVRRKVSTTLEKELYEDLKTLTLLLTLKGKKKIDINSLMEEGIEYILDKYKFKEIQKGGVITTNIEGSKKE